MSAIDNAKKHFAEQDVKVIEVPEWGDENQSLKIYSKPLTLAETSKLYKMSKEDDLTMMAYVLIYKALDENGDKLFDLSDKDQVKQCYNWRNVMPYGGKENLTKNKYVNPEQISFHYENLLEFHKLHKLEFTKKYEDLYAKHLIYAGNPLEP